MTDEHISKLYSGPIQGGGDLPYFVAKQYGSGWLRTLGRFAFPILRRVVGVAMNTGEDLLEGRKDWKQSLRDNTLSEVKQVMRGKRRSTINKRASDDPPNSIFAKKRRK